MANLQLKIAGGTTQPIKLGADAITIGRHPDNRLRIHDDKASRHHCVIQPHNGAFIIRDLGSRNGTRVNGAKVKATKITAGDSIVIGALTMLIEERASLGTAGGSGSEGGPWVAELNKVIDGFGSADIDDQRLLLVDANGETSEALMADADGPRAVRMLLRASSRTRATDIHIEPKGENHNVRMRVDGQMVWVTELPNKVGDLVAGLIKTTCQMRQSHGEAVLDGHFSTRFPDRRVEYRVSFTPSVHGQKLVMRVLDQRGVPTSLGDLNLAGYMYERILHFCKQDTGLLLTCGPTGSGKTTTLYNALREIDREVRNVVTIEDPVEYQIDGVTQIPVDDRRGNGFGQLLRSVLRQDPDAILVGEVRDEDTARTAMQAAMTGHLVFSTVHSKDSISAVFRLLDLKVEPYLVANSLQLVLAQRLVRTLCPTCRSPVAVTPKQATRMGRFLGGKTQIYHAVGCNRCLKTGYRGRHAMFELLDVNDELRDVILNKPSIAAMRKVIEQGLFTTLSQFGHRLVAEGATSMEEVDKITGRD